MFLNQILNYCEENQLQIIDFNIEQKSFTVKNKQEFKITYQDGIYLDGEQVFNKQDKRFFTVEIGEFIKPMKIKKGKFSAVKHIEVEKAQVFNILDQELLFSDEDQIFRKEHDLKTVKNEINHLNHYFAEIERKRNAFKEEFLRNIATLSEDEKNLSYLFQEVQKSDLNWNLIDKINWFFNFLIANKNCPFYFDNNSFRYYKKRSLRYVRFKPFNIDFYNSKWKPIGTFNLLTQELEWNIKEKVIIPTNEICYTTETCIEDSYFPSIQKGAKFCFNNHVYYFTKNNSAHPLNKLDSVINSVKRKMQIALENNDEEKYQKLKECCLELQTYTDVI